MKNHFSLNRSCFSSCLPAPGSRILLVFTALFSALCRNCSSTHFLLGTGLFKTLIYALFCYLLLLLITMLFIRMRSFSGKPGKTRERLYRYFSLSFTRRDVFRVFLLLSLIYFLYLLIFYPGTASWDTANQINDFFDGTAPIPFGFVESQETVNCSLNDHHPVFTTLIYALFTQIGRTAGHQNLGLFLCGFLQVLCSAFVFSLVLCGMSRLNIPWGIRFVGLLYCALFPFIAMHVICVMKDSMYAFLFTAWYFCYCLLLLRPEKLTAKAFPLYALLCLLTALTKKTGIYLLLISTVFLLLSKPLRRHSGKLLASTLLPALLILLILPKAVYPALSVYPGGKQEVLGVCFQQTARTYRFCGEEFTENDLAVIDRVIDVEAMKNSYDPECNDPVKASYRLHCTSEDLRNYLLLWARMGIRHPGIYLESVLTVCGGFFCPDKVIDIFSTLPKAQGVFAGFDMPDLNAHLRNLVTRVYYLLSRIPLLFSIALYIWFIPVSSLAAVLDHRSGKQEKENRGEKSFCSSPSGTYLSAKVLCFVPVAVSCLILIVCPICYARYAVSQLYVIPLLIGLSFSASEAERN